MAAALDSTALARTTALQEIRNRGSVKTRPKDKQSCFFNYILQEAENGWRRDVQIKTDTKGHSHQSHSVVLASASKNSRSREGRMSQSEGADAQERLAAGW